MAERAAATSTVPLRRRLFLLAAAAITPLAAVAGLGLLALLGQQRQEFERAGLELTRALATAVSAELGRSISVLEAVATSPTLDVGDREGFHRRAMRVVESQSRWRAIILVAPDGTPVLHSGYPLDATTPALAERATFDEVVRTGAAAVGDLALDPAGESLAFSVAVPVVRHEELRYVVLAVASPEAILEILQRQRVPADWVISIFDTGGHRVARSRSHAANLGKPGAPSVVALMKQPADEGWGRTVAVEGDPIYTAYSRVKGARWTVATGIPVALVDGAVWRSALVFGGGLLLSLMIALLAALSIGRSITNPIAALRRSAEALGRRAPLDPPVTAIQEIQRVGAALVGAAEERARGESERDDLLRREQSAREAAEAASRAKDEFLAMLGHELRNPLSAVASAVALLEHPGAKPEVVTRARAILGRQTAHLARLTDDLLDVGRAITGKIVLNRRPVEVSAVVARALATIEPTVEASQHRLVRDLKPIWVDADPVRIEQIVANLVGNAVKYTTRAGTITVAVGYESGEAVLRVTDEGIGMSPELALRAFDLFVQGDRPLDRASGGLGIGLTLVQRLAQLHGGTATLFSPGPGQGSVVTVRFPAITPPADAVPVPAPVTEAASNRVRDVLVVEDNDDARTALCELLELAGHHVRAAEDGQAGLTAALEGGAEIALIDIGLPGMDGYELARRIRAAGAGRKRITLVALTGYGLSEDRARALAAGFDVHLVKPVSMDALAKVLAA